MRYILLFFTLFVSLYAVPISQKKELQEVSLQLHWKYQFQFAGFIAAKEKGFYKEAGLDVTLKEFQHGMNIVDEILQKKANYGIYNSNILIGFLHDKPIRLLSSFFKRSALVLIVKPEIKSPKDLKGKKVMAAGEKDFLLNFSALMDEYNLKLNDIDFVEHTHNINDFINNKIDAMTAYISDQPYKLDKKRVKYNIINPSDIGLFNLQLELFTSKEETLHHTMRTVAFREASHKGWEYALKNKEELIEIIHNKYANHLSKEELRAEAQEIEKLMLPKIYDIGSIDENFMHRQFKEIELAYDIVQSKNFNDFIFKSLEDETPLFTKEERAYIKENPEITLCLQANLFPFDGYYDKQHTGIMGDIYKEISHKSGLKFLPLAPIDDATTKQNVIQKKCSMVSLFIEPNKELQTLSMSKPLFKSYFTIFSRLDKSFVDDPHRLEGEKLLVRFASYKEKILQEYPYLDVEVEGNIYLLMQKLLRDEVFGVVTLNETSDYLVEKYGYGKLKVNGFLLKEGFEYGTIAIDTNAPLLVSIIEKSLESISHEKRQSIIDSWKMTRYHNETDYSLVIKILGVMLVLFTIMAYYQRRLYTLKGELQEEVKLKTKELTNLNASLENTVQEKIEELIKKDVLLTHQSKQAVMGEMINMIAHQWRQPLSAITIQIANIQLQRMLGLAMEDDRKEKILSDISDKVIYLSETIDDFQTFFRPDRTSTKMEVEQIFKRALSLNAARVAYIDIHIDIVSGKDVYVEVYLNELIQVLLNLINNAIDAFEDVQREVKKIELLVKEDKESVSLCVKDNASGISEENIKKLFEPYYSTKGKNGTGLGLYMSQMIIQKQFGGEINVESSSEGTTFIITITKDMKKHT